MIGGEKLRFGLLLIAAPELEPAARERETGCDVDIANPRSDFIEQCGRFSQPVEISGYLCANNHFHRLLGSSHRESLFSYQKLAAVDQLKQPFLRYSPVHPVSYLTR